MQLGIDTRVTVLAAGLIFLVALCRMTMLILGAIGGFAVLLAGFVAGQFF
jgi:hypothetical protein